MNTVTVNPDHTVTVTINGVEADHCGPWDSHEAAQAWATLMLVDLENGVVHYPDHQQT